MRPRTVVFSLLLSGCGRDPAELTVSVVEPVIANAQYFHGNCFAGFSFGVDLRVQETAGVGVVLSRLVYRLADQGTAEVISDESLDARAIEQRYGAGASTLPSNGIRLYHLVGVSRQPVGPISVAGEIEGLDDNEQRVAEAFQLSAALAVNDPGPPSDGACSTP